jgi:hypothetical protein
MDQPKNTPMHRIPVGGVTAVIWKNIIQVKGKQVPTLNVSLERSYKDGQGNWKSTGSLKPHDIAKAISALQKAFDWIHVDLPKAIKAKEQEKKQEAVHVDDLDALETLFNGLEE